MAKEATKVEASGNNSEPTDRQLIEQRYAALGKAGIRLAADKAWLRPAIEGAIDGKIAAALSKLSDEDIAVIAQFTRAVL